MSMYTNGSGPEPRRRGRRVPVTAAVVIVVATVAGLEVAGELPGPHTSAAALARPSATSASPGSSGSPDATTTPSAAAAGLATVGATQPPAAPGFSATLPGIGTRYGSRIPADTTQVVVAYGTGVDATTTTVQFFEKVPGGWQLQDTWTGHNGDQGWSADKHAGDLRSPIGVYTLTDAGGKFADPGTKLTYIRSSSFTDWDTGFHGESLRQAFNYVIAINYNHKPGTSPESDYYPQGEDKGGNVWLHVDHGGPTHACISIPQDGVKALLEALNPADHPVIVMGDRADLAAD